MHEREGVSVSRSSSASDNAPVRTRGPARLLELVYRLGIILKGVDGLIEQVAGLALWLAPGILRALLAPVLRTESDDAGLRVIVAHAAGRLDDTLARGSSFFVIFFLLTHGIVKLVLVYCLLKEYLWVYPYALVVLGLFAVYQGVVLVQSPSVALVLLAILDIVIIWLVWREWRSLSRDRSRRT
jgi:uncharacterized membrane protein